MFDAAADKQKRAAEQRRRDAKRRLLEQQKKAEQSDALQAAKDFREEQRLQEIRKLEEERLRIFSESNGVDIARRKLKVVPDSRTDDKLTLPPSVLEELVRHNVFQNITENKQAVVFEVVSSTTSTSSSAGDAVTHCGVADFTANEGEVWFGPKVLFSLLSKNSTNSNSGGTIKSEGSSQSPSSASSMPFVDLRFRVLPRHERCRCTFQPKGAGFFDASTSSDVVNMDLRALLEAQLQFHTCLTEGDVIPLRHDGKTFYLQAKLLEPDEAFLLRDCEMEIEVMPSEQVEFERKLEARKMERKRRAEEELQKEVERREKWVAEDVPSSSGAGAAGAASSSAASSQQMLTEVQVRLPTGKSVTRKVVAESTKLKEVFTWLNNLPETLEFTYRKPVFHLVQSWPGHSQTFEYGRQGEESLAALGLKGRREQLFFKAGGGGGGAGEQEKEEVEKSPHSSPASRIGSKDRSISMEVDQPELPRLPSDWKAAGDVAFARIDHEGNATMADAIAGAGGAANGGGPMRSAGGNYDGDEDQAANNAASEESKMKSVDIFHLLRTSPGQHTPQEDATYAQKWGKELAQLMELGFGPEVWITQCIPFLKKWNGLMPRVVNSLMLGETPPGAAAGGGVEQPSA
mmetsp:Transcript_8473/g.20395  ORF Transcript_8473/g.20395 Transcript_8473/m.20395 type:complete len:631 (+) Transcript_8473:232-2124(+)|eukprot:CAMPEP_0178992934 /NCGR_PEP_ID=MMETSP0795-20121207/6402_1 /TAXON_ID=88552 /ORGANISM="Amoebophrya sp., Strain Ameob2" /LENGTH=630 /DNA_ID=CAMNT_0020684895 /DNA_START=212 /DNA_END=2107 /DNA_ORIENTATION=+